MLVSAGFEFATSHTTVFPIRNKLSKPVSGKSACFEGFQQCEPMKSRIYVQQSIGILSDAFKSKKKNQEKFEGDNIPGPTTDPSAGF